MATNGPSGLRRTLAMCLAAGALALGGGCRSVSVSIDPSLSDQTTEVHLVGVNPSEYSTWWHIPMDEYWSPECELRRQAVRMGYAHVMKFAHGWPPRRTLPADDPIWDTWRSRKARDLFVLAYLRGDVPKGDGDQDGRRRIHRLDPWAPGGCLRVTIGPGSAVLENPRAAPAKP